MKIPKPIIKYIGPKAAYSDKIIYSTIEECVAYCKDKKELAIDIETCRKYQKGQYNESVYQGGLDPYLSDIVMLQIGDIHTIYVIDVRTTDISLLLPVFEDKTKLFIGANLKFEAKHLQHKYGIVLWTIWDCMIVDQNLYNGLQVSKDNPDGYRFSLEAMAERYLGVKPVVQKDLFTPEEEEDVDSVYIDKSTRLGFITIGERLFTETQILYGTDDILYPILIKEQQTKGWNSYNPVELHKLENKFTLVLADIEYQGMAFDRKQWTTVFKEKQAVYIKRKEKLDSYVVANYKQFCKQPDLFNTEYVCNIEWSSSQQVIKLFKHIGICPQEKSKDTGRVDYTVGAKALIKLLPNDYKEKYNNDEETDIVENKDLILNYLLLSAVEQACTTFGEKWLKYVHPITGKVHSSYKQILNTGRVSSKNPNLQNIPSEECYRKAFVAGEDGILINCDYSSQEARVVADICGDESMIRFFNEGDPVHGSDYHSMTATKLFSVMRKQPDLLISKKTHPTERNQAKTISFKIIYGGAADTLKDDLGVDKEQAQIFIDSYLNAFPDLKAFFEKSHKNALEKGYIEIDPITQRRYWEPKFSKMKELQEKTWAMYPKDYKKLSPEKKQKAKDKLYEEHPEIKGYWREIMTTQGELMRCSQNYPVQGTSGSQTKTAGIIFRDIQLNKNLKGKIWITNMIHDEVIVECKKEYAEEARELLEKCMVLGAKIFCKKVTMAAEAVITDFWRH